MPGVTEDQQIPVSCVRRVDDQKLLSTMTAEAVSTSDMSAPPKSPAALVVFQARLRDILLRDQLVADVLNSIADLIHGRPASERANPDVLWENVEQVLKAWREGTYAAIMWHDGNDKDRITYSDLVEAYMQEADRLWSEFQADDGEAHAEAALQMEGKRRSYQAKVATLEQIEECQTTDEVKELLSSAGF